MPSTPKSAPHNNSPDNETPDNATPDNATPDDSTPDNATPDNSTPDNATPDNSTPDNATPDNSTPDNATPDNSTPDNADGSPPKSPESSSKSPPPPSPPPPEESSPSPPPPEDSSPSPPPPSKQLPPPPPPEKSEEKSPPPPPPSESSKTPSPPPPTQGKSNSSPPPPTQGKSNSSPPPPTQGKSNSSVPSPPSSGRSSGSSSSNGRGSTTAQTPALPSSSDSRGSSDDGLQKRAIIGGVVGVGTFLIILVLVCFICRKKKRKQVYYYGDHALGKENGYYNNAPPGWQGGPPGDHVMRVQNGMGHGGGWGGGPPLMNSTTVSSNYSGGPPPLAPSSPSMNMGLAQGTFTYDELAAATNGFIEANLIGQGGFGYVHKGVLPNGKEVAVKSLKANSGQGEREFQAEIEIISRVHHRHLVSLVGYCITGQQRMLVYEFVPNKTLEHHLHGKGQPTMDWPSRLRIALGSAKGLAYLHEDCHPRIIHRDIKAANVLIDDSFEAKVADFGLAKLTSDTNTHVSTRVMGTFGYLAPEYAQSGKLTEKSDVFSFGVMLLELITGKRPVDITNAMEDSLVDWARPLLNRALEEGNFSELADRFLEGNYNNEEMARMAACAAASIRHSGRKRPKMSQIVRALEGDVQLDDLNEGMKPGHSAMYGGGADYDTAQYQIDMKKIRMTALSSQDFNSGSTSNDSRDHTPSQRY